MAVTVEHFAFGIWTSPVSVVGCCCSYVNSCIECYSDHHVVNTWACFDQACSVHVTGTMCVQVHNNLHEPPKHSGTTPGGRPLFSHSIGMLSTGVIQQYVFWLRSRANRTVVLLVCVCVHACRVLTRTDACKPACG